jgi:hypothetical protein
MLFNIDRKECCILLLEIGYSRPVSKGNKKMPSIKMDIIFIVLNKFMSPRLSKVMIVNKA